MSGVPLPWITEWDLMAGWDRHNQLCIPPTPPLPPLPSPMHNHVVGGSMHWIANSGNFPDHTVFVEDRWPCKHYHDLSWLIPHVPVPLPGWVLLPVIIPLSSSKIVLGSFSVQCKDKSVGLWGPMLNCWSLFPRPTGVIIPTRLPTVFVGISWMDLLISALFMGFDMLLSFLLNKAFDKWLKPLINARLDKALGAIFKGEVMAAVNQSLRKLSGEVIKKGFGKLGKLLPNSVREWVYGLYMRTNPGMVEKYIVVFEQEAPQTFARMLYDNTHDDVRRDLAESMAAENPEITAEEILADPEGDVSYEEFEQAYVQNSGEMVKTGTRGLLSGDEWEKVLEKEPSPITAPL